MASKICQIMLIIFLIPNGGEFRPQGDISESMPCATENSYMLNKPPNNKVTSESTERTRHRFNGRERRRRPISQPLSNSTVIIRDADGKRRIVYYDAQTLQFVNLRDDAYNGNKNAYLANRENEQTMRDTNDNIVFPGPVKGGSSRRFFEPKVPDNCKNSLTFCPLVENYPTSYVEEVLQNTALSYQEFNGTDEIESEGALIGQRIDYTDEASLCISVENIVFPKTAQNKNNKWVFIINEPKFVQGVRVETCQSENQECAYSQNFPSGYKSMCKQKYIYRKMLAIDNSGEQVIDNFRLPSCCSCILQSLPISSRSGFDPMTQSKAIRRRRNVN